MNHVTQAIVDRAALAEGTDTTYLTTFTNQDGTFCPGFNLYAVEHNGTTYAVEADEPGNVATNLFFRTMGAINLPKECGAKLLGENPCAVAWNKARKLVH